MLQIVTESNSLSPLGALEHELLTILWAQMTAVGVRKQLARKLKDATVRTVLRRLEEKGHVTHSVEAGTFLYRPEETAESAAAIALKGIVDGFCDGSVERAMLALADATRVAPSSSP